MALPKLFQRIFWNNNTTPAINATNLNSMSKAIDDIDNRVVSLAGTVMEDVPELQDMADQLEGYIDNPSYIGTNGNWYVWDVTTGDYVDSGISASINLDVVNVVKTGSTGLVDHYRLYYGDGNYFDYNVTNGRDAYPTEILHETLTSGSTSVTFTNLPTTGDHFYEIYTSKAGLDYLAIDDTTSGQITITFDAQSSNVTVYLIVAEVE